MHPATLSALVMDGSNGVPLGGVTITLKNARLSLTTDAAGRYRFDEASGDKVTFSKVGDDSISRDIKPNGGSENAVITLAGEGTYVCTTAEAEGRWQIAGLCMILRPRHRISPT